MKQVLIFAGTTEGRRLAECLAAARIPASVCVATEYGETLLPRAEGITHLMGRLDEGQMESLMKKEDFSCVVDATHPYAVAVSENIRKAAEKAGLAYLRLLRENTGSQLEDEVEFAESVRDAVSMLKRRTGNILASTGSKELSEYTALEDYKTRVYARVLSTEESVLAASRLGFAGRNLICMQGPFSEDMNYATMKQYGISWLVTKASGKAGGYEEKLRAAKRAGAGVIVVGRPREEDGLTFEEVKGRIFEMAGKMPALHRKIALVSMGTGDLSLLTKEAWDVLAECDVILGAKRMVEGLSAFGKPSFISYKNEELLEWLEVHPEYVRPAVAFSGDIGFYSGAKKLLPLLCGRGYTVRLIPGVSSLVYFADRMGVSWDDGIFMSIHGRTENLLQAVRTNRKVFTLLGGKDCVRELCDTLLFYGFSGVTLTVGEELSYEGEKIRTGSPEELREEAFESLAVALIENPEAGDHVVTHGIPDEEFLRGKVPMTKLEVRAVSLSRMKLKRDSVIYDIGAGTGSVSVEAALQACDGTVYAIEKNEEAVSLLRENKQKFAVPNMEIVEGLAPEAMEELPAPTHAFIGGSSGNMRDIVRLILKKNEKARIVINAIALETVAEAMEVLKEFPVEDVEVSQVTASRGKRLGRYEMMMGMNPVYIISFSGSGGKTESERKAEP